MGENGARGGEPVSQGGHKEGEGKVGAVVGSDAEAKRVESAIKFEVGRCHRGEICGVAEGGGDEGKSGESEGMAGKIAKEEGAAEGKERLSANPEAGAQSRLGKSRNRGEHGVVDVVRSPNMGRAWEDVRVPNVGGRSPGRSNVMRC